MNKFYISQKKSSLHIPFKFDLNWTCIFRDIFFWNPNNGCRKLRYKKSSKTFLIFYEKKNKKKTPDKPPLPFYDINTSLNKSSLLCCFRRSIFFTATCWPVVFDVAKQTIPVDPSPIFIKFSRFSLGSPGLTTICNAARNYNWIQTIYYGTCIIQQYI